MTHLADHKTSKPVCGAKGLLAPENPTCADCQNIQRNYPHLLWTAEQRKTFNENFIATFRGGK